MNYLRIFSVMITDWETNFTDLETKNIDLKFILFLSLSLFLSLALSLSLSLSVSPSLSLSLSHNLSVTLLSCFLSPVLSLAAHPLFLRCSASDFQAFEVAISGLRIGTKPPDFLYFPGIFRHFTMQAPGSG